MDIRSDSIGLLVMTLALWSDAPAAAQPQCRAPTIVAPAMHQTVGELRPVIRWIPVPGALRYRVVLTARKPEGGVLASVDASVSGSELVPPAPLTEAIATVVVTVAAVCDELADASPGIAAAHRFYIDVRPSCRLPGAAHVETAHGRRRVVWSKAVNADRYEVLGYAAFDGTLLFTREVSDEWFVLPETAVDPMAIVVLPRCGAVVGAPAFLLN